MLPILEQLQAPFPPGEIRWKPQAVKGDRALAVAYIDSRIVQERLDQVIGPENWQDWYDVLPGGGVCCRLKVRVGGEWVEKMDVGSPSEQPDAGDRMKAAFSDALKRAAIKFGIGRYLYRLPLQWCAYDANKKQFTGRPNLPAWAVPGGTQAPPPKTEPAGGQHGPAPAPSPYPELSALFDAAKTLEQVEATAVAVQKAKGLSAGEMAQLRTRYTKAKAKAAGHATAA